jgi:hypothetical protein
VPLLGMRAKVLILRRTQRFAKALARDKRGTVGLTNLHVFDTGDDERDCLWN